MHPFDPQILLLGIYAEEIIQEVTKARQLDVLYNTAYNSRRICNDLNDP